MQHIYTVLTFFRAAMNPCYFLPWLFISKVSWRIQLFKSCSAYKRCQGKKRERNHLFTAQICLKATFYHTHMCELTHVWFASWWSLGFYPALCSIFLSFPFPPPSPCSFRWQLIGRSRLKCHPVLLALPHFAILFSQRVSVDMAGLPPGPRVGNLTQWLKNEPFLWFKRKLLKKTLAIKL